MLKRLLFSAVIVGMTFAVAKSQTVNPPSRMTMPLSFYGGGVSFGGMNANGNFIFGAGSPSPNGTTLPAGGSLTTGINNFIFGTRAGAKITDANHNIIMGNDAGFNLVSTGGTNPESNVYIGYIAGKASTGGGNAALGFAAGGGNALASTDNYSMTAIGEQALSMAASSQKDTAVGSSALAVYQRGGQMIGLGRSSGQWISEGSYDVFIGHAAAFFSVAGANNIMMGNGAGAPVAGNPPRITASQSTTTLTVTVKNGADANIAVGMVCVSTTASALSSNITITALDGTGTGGTGTYSVSPSQTVSSQTMQCGTASNNNIIVGNSSYSSGHIDDSNIILGNSVQIPSSSNVTVIGTGQTSATLSGNLYSGTTDSAIANAAGQTITATQLLGGIISRSGAAGVSDTTPTAAAIVAAMRGCEANKTTRFSYIINSNSGTLTLLAGTGITLAGTTTVGASKTRLYRVVPTNCTVGAEAVTVKGVLQGDI